MKVLNAALKRVWFEAVRVGAKKIEYRDMTEYWMRKLVDLKAYPSDLTETNIKDGIVSGDLPLHPIKYDVICFHCQGDEVTLKWEGLDVYTGHRWFCIKLGDKVSEKKKEA